MVENHRPVCPIPHLGYCVYERCTFWDEEARECSGECLGDYESLEAGGQTAEDGPCIIYWTEDTD